MPTFERGARRVPRRCGSTSTSRASARSTLMLDADARAARRGPRHARELPAAHAGRGPPRAATAARPRCRRARSRRCSRCPRCCGASCRSPAPPRRCRRSRARSASIAPTFIAKCHSLGLRVDFWTIDDRDRGRAPARARRRRHHDERSGARSARCSIRRRSRGRPCSAHVLARLPSMISPDGSADDDFAHDSSAVNRQHSTGRMSKLRPRTNCRHQPSRLPLKGDRFRSNLQLSISRLE